ncbi:MAG TPA: pitrilysin family protein [Pirellulales bacterium]|nr:pitrilysin family protein [Pirellulales bacterium]
MEFKTATLENGLEVVAECDPAAFSTALGFFVNTGARDETDEVSGVSHFLEHMVFKGTPSRSAEDVNREFDEMGAHYNAFTNEENTVYYAAILPEYLPNTVTLLADLMRPSLREVDFSTEKKVILEEIKMYDDQPPFGVDDKCRAAFFGNHPLSRSVLGTAASVGALQVDQMRRYFESRYSPRNIVLVGSGRIDFSQLCQTAQECCGGWAKVDAARTLPPAAPHSGFHVVCKDTAAQEYAIMMSPGPTASDADRYAAKILATVLGDDSGSRLYWELVDPGLAEHCSLHHHEYMGAGMFLTYMSCDPEYAAENLQRVNEVYRTALAQGITQAELDRAKNKINSRVVLASERPRGRLFTVGANWVQRREYRSVRDDLDAIEAITLKDVGAVQQTYPLTQSTTFVVGPLAEISPAT